MNLWICDRHRFAEFISNRKPLHSDDVFSTKSLKDVFPSGDKLLLVWQNSPSKKFSLPCAIFVTERSMSNFVAWISTYFRHIRPFTAHCRILSPSIGGITTQQFLPNTQNFLSDMGAVGLGLILSEGIAYSIGKADINRLPFSAYARTLSFAFAQCAQRFEREFLDNDYVFDQVRNGWLSVRELTNQRKLDLSSTEISDVWKLVTQAFSEPASGNSKNISKPLIVEALREIRLHGNMKRETWGDISGPFQKIKSLVDMMEGPREGRVKAAGTAIRELSNGPAGSQRHRAFIAGYMASLIQPGSLDHFPVLFPAIPELRESLLWYGVCSGFSPDTSVDSYGNGLGLLLERELARTQNWLDRPNCDIALSEMEVIMRNWDSAKPNFHTIESGILNVELFPRICTKVKWSTDIEASVIPKESSNERQMKLFNEKSITKQDYFELLNKISESAMSLQAIRKQVEDKFGDKPSKSRKRPKK